MVINHADFESPFIYGYLPASTTDLIQELLACTRKHMHKNYNV